MQVSLEAARVNAKLTQAEAAKAIGCSKDALRNWECGKSMPNSKFIAPICTAYKCELDDLIFLQKYYA